MYRGRGPPPGMTPPRGGMTPSPHLSYAPPPPEFQRFPPHNPSYPPYPPSGAQGPPQYLPPQFSSPIPPSQGPGVQAGGAPGGHPPPRQPVYGPGGQHSPHPLPPHAHPQPPQQQQYPQHQPPPPQYQQYEQQSYEGRGENWNKGSYNAREDYNQQSYSQQGGGQPNYPPSDFQQPRSDKSPRYDHLRPESSYSYKEEGRGALHQEPFQQTWNHPPQSTPPSHPPGPPGPPTGRGYSPRAHPPQVSPSAPPPPQSGRPPSSWQSPHPSPYRERSPVTPWREYGSQSLDARTSRSPVMPRHTDDKRPPTSDETQPKGILKNRNFTAELQKMVHQLRHSEGQGMLSDKPTNFGSSSSQRQYHNPSLQTQSHPRKPEEEEEEARFGTPKLSERPGLAERMFGALREALSHKDREGSVAEDARPGYSKRPHSNEESFSPVKMPRLSQEPFPREERDARAASSFSRSEVSPGGREQQDRGRREGLAFDRNLSVRDQTPTFRDSNSSGKAWDRSRREHGYDEIGKSPTTRTPDNPATDAGIRRDLTVEIRREPSYYPDERHSHHYSHLAGGDKRIVRTRSPVTRQGGPLEGRLGRRRSPSSIQREDLRALSPNLDNFSPESNHSSRRNVAYRESPGRQRYHSDMVTKRAHREDHGGHPRGVDWPRQRSLDPFHEEPTRGVGDSRENRWETSPARSGHSLRSGHSPRGRSPPDFEREGRHLHERRNSSEFFHGPPRHRSPSPRLRDFGPARRPQSHHSLELARRRSPSPPIRDLHHRNAIVHVRVPVDLSHRSQSPPRRRSHSPGYRDRRPWSPDFPPRDAQRSFSPASGRMRIRSPSPDFGRHMGRSRSPTLPYKETRAMDSRDIHGGTGFDRLRHHEPRESRHDPRSFHGSDRASRHSSPALRERQRDSPPRHRRSPPRRHHSPHARERRDEEERHSRNRVESSRERKTKEAPVKKRPTKRIAPKQPRGTAEVLKDFVAFIRSCSPHENNFKTIMAALNTSKCEAKVSLKVHTKPTKEVSGVLYFEDIALAFAEGSDLQELMHTVFDQMLLLLHEVQAQDLVSKSPEVASQLPGPETGTVTTSVMYSGGTSKSSAEKLNPTDASSEPLSKSVKAKADKEQSGKSQDKSGDEKLGQKDPSATKGPSHRNASVTSSKEGSTRDSRHSHHRTAGLHNKDPSSSSGRLQSPNRKGHSRSPLPPRGRNQDESKDSHSRSGSDRNRHHEPRDGNRQRNPPSRHHQSPHPHEEMGSQEMEAQVKAVNSTEEDSEEAPAKKQSAEHKTSKKSYKIEKVLEDFISFLRSSPLRENNIQTVVSALGASRCEVPMTLKIHTTPKEIVGVVFFDDIALALTEGKDIKSLKHQVFKETLKLLRESKARDIIGRSPDIISRFSEVESGKVSTMVMYPGRPIMAQSGAPSPRKDGSTQPPMRGVESEKDKERSGKSQDRDSSSKWESPHQSTSVSSTHSSRRSFMEGRNLEEVLFLQERVHPKIKISEFQKFLRTYPKKETPAQTLTCGLKASGLNYNLTLQFAEPLPGADRCLFSGLLWLENSVIGVGKGVTMKEMKDDLFCNALEELKMVSAQKIFFHSPRKACMLKAHGLGPPITLNLTFTAGQGKVFSCRIDGIMQKKAALEKAKVKKEEASTKDREASAVTPSAQTGAETEKKGKPSSNEDENTENVPDSSTGDGKGEDEDTTMEVDDSFQLDSAETQEEASEPKSQEDTGEAPTKVDSSKTKDVEMKDSSKKGEETLGQQGLVDEKGEEKTGDKFETKKIEDPKDEDKGEEGSDNQTPEEKLKALESTAAAMEKFATALKSLAPQANSRLTLVIGLDSANVAASLLISYIKHPKKTVKQYEGILVFDRIPLVHALQDSEGSLTGTLCTEALKTLTTVGVDKIMTYASNLPRKLTGTKESEVTDKWLYRKPTQARSERRVQDRMQLFGDSISKLSSSGQKLVQEVDVIAKEYKIRIFLMFFVKDLEEQNSYLRCEMFVEEMRTGIGKGAGEETSTQRAYEATLQLFKSKEDRVAELRNKYRCLQAQVRLVPEFLHYRYKNYEGNLENNTMELLEAGLYPADMRLKMYHMVLTFSRPDPLTVNAAFTLQDSCRRCGLLLEWRMSFSRFKHTCRVYIQKLEVSSATASSRDVARQLAFSNVVKSLSEHQDIIEEKESLASWVTKHCQTLERLKEKAAAKKATASKGEVPKDGPEVAVSETEADDRRFFRLALEDILEEYINEVAVDDIYFAGDLPPPIAALVKEAAVERSLRFQPRTVKVEEKTREFMVVYRRLRSQAEIIKILQLCGGSCGRFRLMKVHSCLSEAALDRARAQYLTDGEVVG